MPPIVRYLLRRLLALPVTLLIVTAALYAFMMLTPAEQRASLFLPRRIDRMTSERIQLLTEEIIRDHHLNDPFPIQYGYWAVNLLKGEWGYSPLMQNDVLEIVSSRSPVTMELTLYTLLAFIPLGLISGLQAARKHHQFRDRVFRFSAFGATSIPPFILAILLMGIFYITLGWFPPDRLSTEFNAVLHSQGYTAYTGMVTVDGLLNGRPDLTLDALRHLVLPVISLGLLHWATLGRVSRVTAIEEHSRLYVTSARARGVPEGQIAWRHILRNILTPALSNSALSAASLFTGVIVIEKVFNLKGISDLALSITSIPDMSAVMGFAVYSVLVVLAVMLFFDLLQAIFDPRVQMGVNHE
jgi:ABC-type dipeptide/oligopeptide/nickel transport system permease component